MVKQTIHIWLCKINVKALHTFGNIWFGCELTLALLIKLLLQICTTYLQQKLSNSLGSQLLQSTKILWLANKA